ncbi:MULTISPECIES: hypothetical protein [Pontibacillus]|uniref:Uncharacterized protein n=1 Tax=Pontibacillus chungwhensis TaxID=265426 RepID=A0ABY8V4C6_9BACI|nr:MULTISPECIES: hypothetical protein [Pontibacillus]MCD5326128.1 hypothetical protein [Pontibacillus sp. HN14]WIG00314.1 hypothetical protein QNI29_20925 [Pontibacillus chungwhensis]
MGMYTGLRCKVIIKKEYREELKRLHENRFDWSKSEVDFIKEFSEVERSDFIPFGSSSYMPKGWEDGFEYGYDEETGLLKFACSLKNYSDAIEEFNKVLGKVIEEVIHLEKRNEELESGKLYVLVQGDLVEENINKEMAPRI